MNVELKYQVQEKLKDGSWGWFCDFRSWREADNMKDVYQRFYPGKKFRIVLMPSGLWGG